jgi:hypothetical protein
MVKRRADSRHNEVESVFLSSGNGHPHLASASRHLPLLPMAMSSPMHKLLRRRPTATTRNDLRDDKARHPSAPLVTHTVQLVTRAVRQPATRAVRTARDTRSPCSSVSHPYGAVSHPSGAGCARPSNSRVKMAAWARTTNGRIGPCIPEQTRLSAACGPQCPHGRRWPPIPDTDAAVGYLYAN